ncbi:MAG: rhodanese-like domain-containing protein [Nitrospiraceae bacterium]|nr:MAG: rhodanese-like domain-containing protein [Nitrospiraceae bacterium]
MVKKQWLILMMVLTVLMVGGIVFAGPYSDELNQKVTALKTDGEAGKEMPASIPGINVISTADAYKMYKDKKAVFLDCRPKAQYDTERVQGAEIFTADDFINDPSMADKLDKNKSYVLYCNGVKCWRSTAVSVILHDHFGFKNIYWHREGFPDWKKNNHPLE